MSTGMFVVLVAYVASSTTGLLLMRHALSNAAGSLFRLETLTNVTLMSGVVSYVLSFMFWMLALSRMKLSVVYPLFLGTGYATVTLASTLVLRETLTATHVLGLVLVGIGVLLLVRA